MSAYERIKAEVEKIEHPTRFLALMRALQGPHSYADGWYDALKWALGLLDEEKAWLDQIMRALDEGDDARLRELLSEVKDESRDGGMG